MWSHLTIMTLLLQKYSNINVFDISLLDYYFDENRFKTGQVIVMTYSAWCLKAKFKLLCLIKDHWWGCSTRNAHIVNIVNSIRFKMVYASKKKFLFILQLDDSSYSSWSAIEVVLSTDIHFFNGMGAFVICLGQISFLFELTSVVSILLNQ